MPAALRVAWFGHECLLCRVDRTSRPVWRRAVGPGIERTAHAGTAATHLSPARACRRPPGRGKPRHPADLPGELTDVLEILRALTMTAGISWPQLLALAKDKSSGAAASEEGSSPNQWNETAARPNRSRCSGTCTHADERALRHSNFYALACIWPTLTTIIIRHFPLFSRKSDRRTGADQDSHPMYVRAAHIRQFCAVR